MTIIRTLEQIDRACEFGVLSLDKWEAHRWLDERVTPAKGLLRQPGDILTLATKRWAIEDVRVVEMVTLEAFRRRKTTSAEQVRFLDESGLPWVAIITVEPTEVIEQENQ
jgi:hypothetical protein